MAKQIIIDDTPIEKLQNELSKARNTGKSPSYRVGVWTQDPKTGEVNAKITIAGREFIAKSPQDGINILSQLKGMNFTGDQPSKFIKEFEGANKNFEKIQKAAQIPVNQVFIREENGKQFISKKDSKGDILSIPYNKNDSPENILSEIKRVYGNEYVPFKNDVILGKLPSAQFEQERENISDIFKKEIGFDAIKKEIDSNTKRFRELQKKSGRMTSSEAKEFEQIMARNKEIFPIVSQFEDKLKQRTADFDKQAFSAYGITDKTLQEFQTKQIASGIQETGARAVAEKKALDNLIAKREQLAVKERQAGTFSSLKPKEVSLQKSQILNGDTMANLPRTKEELFALPIKERLAAQRKLTSAGINLITGEGMDKIKDARTDKLVGKVDGKLKTFPTENAATGAGATEVQENRQFQFSGNAATQSFKEKIAERRAETPQQLTPVQQQELKDTGSVVGQKLNQPVAQQLKEQLRPVSPKRQELINRFQQQQTKTPEQLDPEQQRELQDTGSVTGVKLDQQRFPQGFSAPNREDQSFSIPEAPQRETAGMTNQFSQQNGTIFNQDLGKLPGVDDQQISQAITTEKESAQKLRDFLNRDPKESAVERLQRLNKEAGRADLVQSREQTLQSISRINNLLRNVERGVQLRGQDVGITAVQGQRLIGQEERPLAQTLGQLNDALTLTNQSISQVDKVVSDLFDAGNQDQAQELQRLTQAASQPGLTETEKSVLSEQIKTQRENSEALIKQQSKTKDAFTKGLADLRSLVVEEGIITNKFPEGVRIAINRFEEGEDPESILADLSSAIGSNEILQAKFDRLISQEEADLARTRKLAGLTGGTQTTGRGNTTAEGIAGTLTSDIEVTEAALAGDLTPLITKAGKLGNKTDANKAVEIFLQKLGQDNPNKAETDAINEAFQAGEITQENRDQLLQELSGEPRVVTTNLQDLKF